MELRQKAVPQHLHSEVLNDKEEKMKEGASGSL